MVMICKNAKFQEELFIDGLSWMTDCPEEIEHIKKVTQTAKGNCFVGGLGLGLIVKELLKNPDVKHIDVIEINTEVIGSCSKRVEDLRVTVHHGDATKFFPNPPYDWVYFDIWFVPLSNKEKEDVRILALPFLKKNGCLEIWEK